MSKRFGFFRPKGVGAAGVPFQESLSATYTILSTDTIDNGIRIELDSNYPVNTTVFVEFDGLSNDDMVEGNTFISGVTDVNGNITYADTFIYAASNTTTTKPFTLRFRPSFTAADSKLNQTGNLTWTGSNVTSSGGTETTVNGNKVHTYTYSGSGSTSNDTLVISGTTFGFRALVVAGGGAGGSGSANAFQSGGGGAGGTRLIYGVGPTATYATIVGRGGIWVDQTGVAGSHPGESGKNSQFSSFVTCTGGGGGGSTEFEPSNGQGGGSGGGGGGSVGEGLDRPGGTPVSGQGNTGGNGKDSITSTQAGGGSGGAGSVGADATASTGGQGGTGVVYDISGSSVTYSAGGNGGVNTNYQTGSGTTTFGGGGHYNKSGVENGGNGIIIVEVPAHPRSLSLT